MKIAFIVGAFPTLSETFILNQITGLLDLGHDLDIFAHFNPSMEKIHPDIEAYRLMERTFYFNAPDKKVARVLKALGLLAANFHKAPLRLLRALNVFKFGKEALSLRLLYTLVPFLGKEQEYDIIHCHFGPNGKIGVLLNKLGVGGEVITSFYGYDISAHFERLGKTIYDFLFREGDLFIAISDAINERLIKLGCDKSKVVKHPLGIDVGKSYCEERKRQIGEKVKILTVARLVEKKGLEYSIKAVAKVARKHPDVEYNIAGDGPLRGRLKSLISELDVKEKVRLLGWQDQDQIRGLYQDSHIFMLASVTARNGDQEGTPTVLMEAQAQGVPIVSTLHSGIPEIVLDGQSGFLAPERDADALAQRLEYLIEHPEIWPAMGRAGRKFVEEHHDIKKLNRRLVRIYEGLVGGRVIDKVVIG